jgi:hypothetical protein
LHSTQHNTDESTNMSSVFAFSTPELSSIKDDAVPQGYRKVPEKMIQWLLKRYPKGKVFSFRADGSLEEETEHNRRLIATPDVTMFNGPRTIRASSVSSRPKEAEFLLEVFRGARCIALTPLWDAHRERFFSLGFVWTNDPRRILTVESDLSYLTAFGNTMMAEIARLDSVAAKKAKADLLGSISHEVKFADTTLGSSIQFRPSTNHEDSFHFAPFNLDINIYKSLAICEEVSPEFYRYRSQVRDCYIDFSFLRRGGSGLMNPL